VVLPAFLLYEPAHELEQPGPLLVALAMIALLSVGDGLRRGWRACAATQALYANCRHADRRLLTAGKTVEVVDVPEPIVAVIGGRRPRIIASQDVLNTLSQEELHHVVAHEAAHVLARDNLKLLLLIVCPDVLAWLPDGARMAARWRAAVEFEADERAVGADRHGRIALASALIKVARLVTHAERPFAALSMSIAVDDVEGRVRRLLSPSPGLSGTVAGWRLIALAVLVPVAGIALYWPVHRFIEALVAFGN